MVIVGCTMGKMHQWYFELRIMGVFVFLAQAYKMIVDWLRLFQFTSFYVTLIIRTIQDMIPFLVIMLILLILVGEASLILELNNVTRINDHIMVDRSSFEYINFLFNPFFSQYKMMLGEFDTEMYDDLFPVHKALCYIIFIISTLVVQIVFLNMLIAIMGDTYGREIELKHVHSVRNQIN